MADVGMWQGLEKATGVMANTGMDLLRMKQQENQQAIQNEDAKARLQMAQEQADRERKAAELQRKKMEDDEKLIDVDENLSAYGISSPKEIEYMKRRAIVDIEKIGGRDYIKKSRGRETFQKDIRDPQVQYDIGNMKIENIDEQVQQIDAQLKNPEAKLKPEQVKQMSEQRMMLMKARTNIANGIKSAEAQLKIKEEMPFGAAGGGVVYDKRTGRPSYIPPQKNTPERSSSFDRDYDAYLEQAKTNYPNLRPMTREEFREDQVKRLAQARTAGREKKQEPVGIDVAQERAWAQEAIRAGKNKADVIKNFELRTGTKF